MTDIKNVLLGAACLALGFNTMHSIINVTVKNDTNVQIEALNLRVSKIDSVLNSVTQNTKTNDQAIHHGQIP